MLLSEALRPAETTDRWREAPAPAPDALSGIWRIDCHDAGSEAEVIALLMREALETPERTAVLITPDRDLSRRVSSELKRWDVEVDDSAGVGLDQSPPGVFLRLIARLLADRAAPVSLLAALKHPLAAGGASADVFRRHVRALELAVLRGPSPGEGFDGIARALNAAQTDQELKDWFAGLTETARPMMAWMRERSVDFAGFVRDFIGFAENLSMAGEGAEPALWAGAFGEAAAAFVSELLRAADVMGEITPNAWPDLLDVLMGGRMVRPRQGQHPRLQIWGPIEGRLGRADLVILGGLNEGSWPPEAASDPWMSRPMREKFGLPLPEQRLGLSAHDFQQAFAAREVVLTRAEKIDGTPTVPSRWLLRLDAFLQKSGLTLDKGETGAPRWQAALDQPDGYHPVLPPRPTPPVAARPRRLSVTRIEKWIKDPYSIFAGEILKLRPLDDIAMDPSAADRGTFIHAALERFIREHPVEIPVNAFDLLLDYGREAFGDALLYPAVWAFWWPRFERIADWFIGFEEARRESYRSRAIEKKGTIEIPAPQGAFTLSGTADRIDRHMMEGTLSVLDYKTGSLPSVKEVESGVTPQLALEAAMIKHGGFAELAGDEVTELAYIRLGGGSPAGEFRPAGGKQSPPAADMAAEAYDGLQRLIAQFDRQATPYLSRPRPDLPDRFNDYEHLARVKEWSSGEESEE
ncbi:MAG: double-strand break repair protein AddB [Alphaproteobacteria bacterium]|nr:MAG: double-strand break repair protein AddB [Alphaproteobacteria bacterium]